MGEQNNPPANPQAQHITLPVNRREANQMAYELLITLRNSIRSCLTGGAPSTPILEAWIRQCEVIEFLMEQESK